MVYKWKTVNYSVPANVVGEYFEELEANNGPLTNQIVLDGARAESSPIHPLFEWDDQIAAEQYRLNQATKLICNLTVEIETEDKPIEVRAYMNVSEQKTGEFINTTQAFKSADSREIILKRAYQELEAFKQKYKNLTELAKVFEAIDELKTPA